MPWPTDRRRFGATFGCKFAKCFSFRREAQKHRRVIRLRSHSSDSRLGCFGQTVGCTDFSSRSTLAIPIAGVSFAPVLAITIAGASEPFLVTPNLLKSLGH